MEEISREELDSLTKAIEQRYGIDFTSYEPKSLTRRIARAISVFDMESIHDLWVKMLRERDFIYPFIDEITVGLTSMFRDPKIWTFIKDLIQKEYTDKPLNIWHAGCSTGEEVYTMSIVLKEANIGKDYHAVATDLNTKFLANAQSGEYIIEKKPEYEKNYFKYNPKGNFNHYARTNGKAFHMDKSLLNHAEFHQLNLVSETFDDEFDIIFCRNVLIYFDKELKEKILEKFYKRLKPGGYFIIGYFDSIFSILDRSKFKVVDKDAKIYKKIA